MMYDTEREGIGNLDIRRSANMTSKYFDNGELSHCVSKLSASR